MGGGFEIRQRFEAELVMQPRGECGANPGDGGEQCHRVGFTTRSLQHGQPAVRHDFPDRTGDVVAYA